MNIKKIFAQVNFSVIVFWISLSIHPTDAAPGRNAHLTATIAHEEPTEYTVLHKEDIVNEKIDHETNNVHRRSNSTLESVQSTSTRVLPFLTSGINKVSSIFTERNESTVNRKSVAGNLMTAFTGLLKLNEGERNALIANLRVFNDAVATIAHSIRNRNAEKEEMTEELLLEQETSAFIEEAKLTLNQAGAQLAAMKNEMEVLICRHRALEMARGGEGEKEQQTDCASLLDGKRDKDIVKQPQAETKQDGTKRPSFPTRNNSRGTFDYQSNVEPSTGVWYGNKESEYTGSYIVIDQEE